MTPLHTWAVAGAVGGIALPVIIHFLTKPRGVRLPLPGFRFLVETANQTARRNRLRNFLILLARAIAVALIALGFARFADRGSASAVSPDDAKKRGKVIVLDCSLSMNASHEGAQIFDRARIMAQRELAGTDFAEADLVLAAQNSRSIFGKMSANLTALRDEISRSRVLPQMLDASAAIETAAKSLAGFSEDDLKLREVVIISDLQRSNWTKASFGRLPKAVPVRIVAVQSSETLANVAITKAGISGMAEAGALILATADIANYGTAQANAKIELLFDSRTWTKRATLAPGAIENVTFEITNTAPGWRPGAFQVTCDSPLHDSLRDDNRFPICVNVRKARDVALITLEKSTETGGPAYFLEQGLRASPDATVNVTRYTPLQLEGELDEALWRANVIAVTQCGRLSDAQAAGLAKLLSGGVPVLYAVQFGADADNLKQLQNTLAAALRLPVDFQLHRGTASSAPASSIFGQRMSRSGDEGKRFLVSVNSERRPFKIFGDSIARFTQGMSLSGGLASSARSDPGLDADSILASYSDGSAALVITRVAAGRLAVLNLPIGGPGSHLAAYPIFVPLIQELSVDLLEGGSERTGNSGTCGVPFTLPIPRWAVLGTSAGASATSALSAPNLTLIRPNGDIVELKKEGPAFRTDVGGASLSWTDPSEPGAFLIKRDQQVVAGFTITPPFSDESNLTTLDHEVLTQRLAQDRTISVVSSEKIPDPNDPEKETYELFFVAALAMFAFELLILKAFKT